MTGHSNDPYKARTADEELLDALSEFYDDPLGHVMFSYPWDTDASIRVVPLQGEYKERFPNCEFGPDLWACDFLDDLGVEIRRRAFDGVHPVDPIKFATVSGHGIGKSTITGWLVKFLMDTRPEANGTVTAVTDSQLKARTWSEIERWHRLSLTSHLFDISTSRGNMAMWANERIEDGKFKSKWKVEAKTCRPERSEGFAGQHAVTSTSFYILDEASGIDDKIFEVMDGGLSDGEPMVFLFGNGTRNSGQFFEACEGRERVNYIVRSIDSRSVHITNKEKIAQDAKTWIGGEDGDRFRARWRGLFPKRGNQQFIGSDIVKISGLRALPNVEAEQMVLGVDVARFGDDDTVIWPRRGMDARTWVPTIGQGLDTNQVVDLVAGVYNNFIAMGMPVAAIFVDEGYNPGVLDNLQKLRFPALGVSFGNSAIDLTTYRYRVDEMWGKLRDSLNKALCIPDRNHNKFGDRLYDDLTQREYGFTLKGQIRLETKPEMKKRSLPSPDYADALTLTFAQEIATLTSLQKDRQARAHTGPDWHPHDDVKKD